jgi:acetyltransferase-like isoleucine patch superfamily enzyme
MEFFLLFVRKIIGKIKAYFFSVLIGQSISFVGGRFRIHGVKCIFFHRGFRVGDNCWIEAVERYQEQSFTPELKFGVNVMMSNNVHISCVHSITIDDFSLIGSNVYIGDHSHGSLALGQIELTKPPYKRSLSDIAAIYIGKNTWIGDGAVILAGSYICDGCVVGANAVVKGEFRVPCVIAGVPAKAVKLLS